MDKFIREIQKNFFLQYMLVAIELILALTFSDPIPKTR